MSRWFVRTTGQPMTRQVDDLLEYFQTIAEEPCGRTVPRARLGAFALFEYLGGYKEDERLASIPLVAETVNYLEVSFSAGSKPTRKAPNWIIIVVIALELYVMSERAEYLRIVAATEL